MDGMDYPLCSVAHVLGTLHHHLKVFVDLVVLGFGARRERVVGGVDVLAGTVRTAAAVFVFFLVQRLSPSSHSLIDHITFTKLTKKKKKLAKRSRNTKLIQSKLIQSKLIDADRQTKSKSNLMSHRQKLMKLKN